MDEAVGVVREQARIRRLSRLRHAWESGLSRTASPGLTTSRTLWTSALDKRSNGVFSDVSEASIFSVISTQTVLSAEAASYFSRAGGRNAQKSAVAHRPRHSQGMIRSFTTAGGRKAKRGAASSFIFGRAGFDGLKEDLDFDAVDLAGFGVEDGEAEAVLLEDCAGFGDSAEAR